jgi:hypothetical protein
MMDHYPRLGAYEPPPAPRSRMEALGRLGRWVLLGVACLLVVGLYAGATSLAWLLLTGD